jgi:hypothetical protein
MMSKICISQPNVKLFMSNYTILIMLPIGIRLIARIL